MKKSLVNQRYNNLLKLVDKKVENAEKILAIVLVVATVLIVLNEAFGIFMPKV